MVLAGFVEVGRYVATAGEEWNGDRREREKKEGRGTQGER